MAQGRRIPIAGYGLDKFGRLAMCSAQQRCRLDCATAPTQLFVTAKGPPVVSWQPSAGRGTGVATAPRSSADAFSAPHTVSGGYIVDRALIGIPALGELFHRKAQWAPDLFAGFEIEAAGSVPLLQLIWVNERFTAPRASPGYPA
jgi:hypothetical protein